MSGNPHKTGISTEQTPQFAVEQSKILHPKTHQISTKQEDELRAVLGHVVELRAEVELLREQVATLQASSGYEASIAQVEIDRLRAALQDIVDYPHCGPMILRSIARAALEPKP